MSARIAVTGVGVISGLGAGRELLVQALREGLEPEDDLLDVTLDLEQYRETPKTYMDRCSDLALAACWLAVRDADLGWKGPEHPGFDCERIGVSLGTAYGPLDSMLNMTGRVQQKGLRFGSPMIFTHAFVNTPSALIAIEYELQGPNMTHVLGDASAAAALVAAGIADIAVGAVVAEHDVIAPAPPIIFTQFCPYAERLRPVSVN